MICLTTHIFGEHPAHHECGHMMIDMEEGDLFLFLSQNEEYRFSEFYAFQD